MMAWLKQKVSAGGFVKVDRISGGVVTGVVIGYGWGIRKVALLQREGLEVCKVVRESPDR